MNDFAVVSEGFTDQPVLNRILLTYFKTPDYEGRFLFAVCVREIECWLLPLWMTEDKKAKTTGCLDALNTALARQNQPTISREDKNDRCYRNAAAGYKKRKVLLEEGVKNESLRIFLDRISACAVPPLTIPTAYVDET